MIGGTGKPGARFEDPLQLFPWAMTKLFTMWVRATYPFASKGRDWSIHYTCLLHRPLVHRIKLGNSVTIGKDVWLNVPAEAIGGVNIVIDDNCSLAARCLMSAKNYIHLERDVNLAPSVLIMDHNHTYENIGLPISKQPATPGGRIRIGEGCSIGQGAAIVCARGELVLGRNCVVAPNAVVIGSAPPYSLLSGNPARVIEQFDPVNGIWVPHSIGPGRVGPAAQDRRGAGVALST
jgi:acetyltransferase-like isoleucine patch superfamily enzyme